MGIDLLEPRDKVTNALGNLVVTYSLKIQNSIA